MKFEKLGDLFYSGNIHLLNNSLTAIFCSSIIPMTLYLPALDFIKQVFNLDITVISGWHSNVENKLLELKPPKSRANIIIFLAKGIENYKLTDNLIEDYRNNKILTASYWKNEKRISAVNSKSRNQAILEKAKKILFLNIHENGNLHKLFDQSIALNKKVFLLDHPSNERWIEKGACPLSKYNLEEIS